VPSFFWVSVIPKKEKESDVGGKIWGRHVPKAGVNS
jgi:hypothetical protein